MKIGHQFELCTWTLIFFIIMPEDLRYSLSVFRQNLRKPFISTLSLSGYVYWRYRVWRRWSIGILKANTYINLLMICSKHAQILLSLLNISMTSCRIASQLFLKIVWELWYNYSCLLFVFNWSLWLMFARVKTFCFHNACSDFISTDRVCSLRNCFTQVYALLGHGL